MYTMELDYSNYDATQHKFLRVLIDYCLSSELRRRNLFGGDVDI